MALDSRAHEVSLPEVADLIQRRFGYSTREQQYELLGRLVAGILVEQQHGYGEFLRLLATLPVESPFVQRLLGALTNNESYFFREQATVESLCNEVIPELLERRRGQRLLRVWSAGCSGGEELYTIAILLHELIPDFDAWTLELVGTDIDEAVLSNARRAEYGERALRTTSEAARGRYFERHGKTYHLRPQYRRGTRFQVHNLVDPNQPKPGCGQFDLVLCRNVTIYFSPEGLERISTNIASALAEGGVWVAAPSDPKPVGAWSTRVLPGMLVNTSATAQEAKPVLSLVSRPPRRNTLPATPSAIQRSQPPPALPTPKLPPPPPRQAASTSTPDGSSDLAREALGRAHQLANAGEVSAALSLVRELAEAGELNADLHLLEATLLEATGDVRGAVSALKRVLYLEPRRAEAYVRLALLLERDGNRDGAVRALRNAATAAAEVPTGSAHETLRDFAAQHLMRLLRKETEE